MVMPPSVLHMANADVAGRGVTSADKLACSNTSGHDPKSASENMHLVVQQAHASGQTCYIYATEHRVNKARMHVTLCDSRCVAETNGPLHQDIGIVQPVSTSAPVLVLCRPDVVFYRHRTSIGACTISPAVSRHCKVGPGMTSLSLCDSVRFRMIYWTNSGNCPLKAMTVTREKRQHDSRNKVVRGCDDQVRPRFCRGW
jgi:hypothetical protein